MFYKLIVFLLLIASCKSDTKQAEYRYLRDSNLPIDKSAVDFNESIKSSFQRIEKAKQHVAEDVFMIAGLIDIHSEDSTIKVDLKYSTENNFMKTDVYGAIKNAYLQKEVAVKLKQAQLNLKARHPSYSLLIYDAARPLSIQQHMWDTLKSLITDRSRYLSNPTNGSLHNYGAAVDITIVDSLLQPIDMATPFDFFGIEAHPEKEAFLLQKGVLTSQQISNRQLLRKIMREAGFFNIQTEWWHFNACTLQYAANNYSLIK